MIINAKDWRRPAFDNDAKVQSAVAEMLAEIERDGNDAITRYSLKFDQCEPKVIALKPFEEYQLDPDLADSIKLAAKRIEAFASFQKEGLTSKTFSDDYGTFGQVVSPIERVGAYIPGGRYPLISTALMTLIPAKIAGCPVRVACSPSDNPAILAAASLAGATEFIRLGGVQAIGALTFGFDEIEPVNIIVGPGNAWVNEAKKQVQSRVKIDGLAGPSELLAICDGEQPVDWIALDALAQAEHDPLACSLIVSDDKKWLESLSDFLKSDKETLTLIDNGQIELIFASQPAELVDFSEGYAPEHLMLCHQKINAEQLSNYGSLFVGANSAVALGDYISGPNHTLPTLGYAKQSGGLSVSAFLKITTIQNVSDNGRVYLSNAAQKIADAEGLKFHAKSLQIRT
ncbi:histidinol dehydrogenase [Aliikangiella coralliicola]|nr:histidinol dehydrogenase [Aliikangiella coralliicola]